MRHLPRDERGYPIPANILRDKQGKPVFTINDESIRRRQIQEDRCSICNAKIIGGRWFIGGMLSAFHPNGAYIDPPLHDECAHYALKVCPYLAAPSYGKAVAQTHLKQRDLAPNLFIDPTQIAGRPQGDIFVAVLCRTHTVLKRGRYLRPNIPYMRVEFWRHGKLIPQEERIELCINIEAQYAKVWADEEARHPRG